MGLSTARLAADHPAVASVNIVARDVTPNTTSDGAGGAQQRGKGCCGRKSSTERRKKRGRDTYR